MKSFPLDFFLVILLNKCEMVFISPFTVHTISHSSDPMLLVEVYISIKKIVYVLPHYVIFRRKLEKQYEECDIAFKNIFFFYNNRLLLHSYSFFIFLVYFSCHSYLSVPRLVCLCVLFIVSFFLSFCTCLQCLYFSLSFFIPNEHISQMRTPKPHTYIYWSAEN